MNVVIIDYGAGNIFSVKQAFQRLGVDAKLTSDENEIRNASHVIFPGVGHAKAAMENLRKTGLDQVIPTLTQPVLGICLGMQLMCGWNEEGELEGMGIFDAGVYFLNSEKLKIENSRISEFQNSLIRNPDSYRDEKLRRSEGNQGFQNEKPHYPIPHMGWNDVQQNQTKEAFYFVHSYAAEICNDTWGIAEYPIPFSASLRKGNFWGVQFHPEKSGEAGERLLQDFLQSHEFANS